MGVFDGDTLVAYAELMGVDRANTSVLPSHRGRGIGTWLAAWLLDLGRSVGSSVIGMPVPQGSPGDRLLEELGFRVRWTSWVLKLTAGASIPARDLPAAPASSRGTSASPSTRTARSSASRWSSSRTTARPATSTGSPYEDQRHRGLAQALLVDSFARAREHGAITAELSTDSRTGALPLYERVGMVVESIWVNRGMDLATTTENAL